MEEGEAAAGSESPGVDSESRAAHTPQRAEPRAAARRRVERRVAERKAGVDTPEPDGKSPPVPAVVCIRRQASSRLCRMRFLDSGLVVSSVACHRTQNYIRFVSIRQRVRLLLL